MALHNITDSKPRLGLELGPEERKMAAMAAAYGMSRDHISQLIDASAAGPGRGVGLDRRLANIFAHDEKLVQYRTISLNGTETTWFAWRGKTVAQMNQKYTVSPGYELSFVVSHSWGPGDGGTFSFAARSHAEVWLLRWLREHDDQPAQGLHEVKEFEEV